MMVKNKGFRPFREAARNEADQLTAAMEDYLEMIYRLQQENQNLRSDIEGLDCENWRLKVF